MNLILYFILIVLSIPVFILLIKTITIIVYHIKLFNIKSKILYIDLKKFELNLSNLNNKFEAINRDINTLKPPVDTSKNSKELILFYIHDRPFSQKKKRKRTSPSKHNKNWRFPR